MLQVEYTTITGIFEKKSTRELNDNWANCMVYLLFH